MTKAIPTPPCDPEKLASLLRDELSSQTQALLGQHLDSCKSCQQQLEQLAADEAFFRETEALLQRDLSKHRVVHRALNALQAPSSRHHRKQRRKRRQQESLRLLVPSTQPESLGRLGRYEIRGIIGSGGMGTVFHALDPVLNRPVALKVLHSKDSSDEFLREARTIAALNDKHIVKIFEVGRQEDIPYLAMEFVDGLSLHQFLHRQEALRFRQIFRVARQVTLGLIAAHEAGIIHRDIKPSNIILDKTLKRVLITDFGLACPAEPQAGWEAESIAGTPEYMSPEQAAGATLTPQSDLFSLGTLLYILCTRISPFRGPSTKETLHRVRYLEPEPIEQLCPQVPAWFAEGIRRLHAKDPSLRFRSAKRFLRYLIEEASKGPPDQERLQITPARAVEPYMRFDCPICGKRLKTLPFNAGGRVHCTRCSQPLRIPSISEPVTVVHVDPLVATIFKLHARPRWKSGALVQLDLRRTMVTDRDIQVLGGCQKLHTLLLESTAITDESMRIVGTLKSLQYLTLSGTAVTDEGLAHLIHLSNLQTFTLANCLVSDRSIDVILQFSRLTRLRIDGTLISPQGRERLQLGLRNLKLWS